MSLSLILERAKQFIAENGLDNLPAWLRRDPEQFEIIYNYPLANDIGTWPADQSAPSLAGAKPTGLYVHVPFCIGTCSYCHYTRKEFEHADQVDSFLETCHTELALWGRILSARFGQHIETIFIGGGTPTIMAPQQIERFAENLTRSTGITNFSRLREYTWEASPETLVGRGKQKLPVLRGVGVNRLSIGVQSFQPRLIEMCARKHTAEQAEEAYRLAQSVSGE